MLTINNTLDGYLKDVEILGNTIQNEEDLADIRSVGEKVEGQELYEIPVLSVGKNLVSFVRYPFGINSDGNENISGTNNATGFCKVRPNTTYVTSINGVLRGTNQFFYDIDKKFISKSTNPTNTFTTPNNCYYVRNTFGTSLEENFQLEEGTVATPYEPYIEDKLTILSPVQLEKVGDVSDRIVEKNGVWGVEKNVKTINMSNYTVSSVQQQLEAIQRFFINVPGENIDIKIRQTFCNVIPYNNGNGYSNDVECVYSDDSKVDRIWFHVNKNKFESLDYDGINNWIANNKPIVKIPTTQPQFIPLPHDQQIKLRTFANKTNISFLTEIEGTIKAQVPKSLGATVNTHTEQISNLNKELDRVKKLEESTVSTVITESDFTTVEATSNGYFEDVKLEGKTLVNTVTTYDVSRFSLRNATKQDDGYFKLQYGITVNDTNVIPRYGVHLYKPNTTYTIVVDIKENTTGTFLGISAINSCIDSTTISKRDFANLTGISTITFKTRDDITISDKGVPPTYDLYFGIWKDGGDLSKHITFKYWVLEGDHTQNPPSFFEGLKSVGNNTDEIVVSSVNENLFNGEYRKGVYYMSGAFSSTEDGICNVEPLSVIGGNTIYFNNINGNDVNHNRVIELDKDKKYIKTSNNVIKLELDANTQYINFCNFSSFLANPNFKFMVSYSPSLLYKDAKQDKKRLLYYNEETQAWEKPILREWDSIEKHADGKYYYHQRSGEVVLNGSEEGIWCTNPYMTDVSITSHYRIPILNTKRYYKCISSNFINQGIWNKDIEGIEIIEDNNIDISVLNSELSTQDVQGFKQWLQANNVTVVYQLAEEKVYECTNIDLITYANETNYIVESGVLSPKTTLKVHNNISNVVSLLQKKVSLLESNMTKYMITQNRLQLSSTHSADSVTFKVDYTVCSENMSQENYDTDLYNLILNNILVGKDNYDYDHMFNIIMDYASWSQISWDQFDILVGIMDIQHNPPIEEMPTDDEIVEEMPTEIM